MENSSKDGLEVKDVLIVASLLVLFGVYFLGHLDAKRTQKEIAKSCIIAIFSDPDGFDPGSHFTVTEETAPPFPEAIEWINQRLGECLEDSESFLRLHR